MEKASRYVTAFRAPLYIAWEITHKCNAKCLHCYSNSGPDSTSDGELSTREALTLIDQLADIGLLVLAFSGGEPMLRKDWPHLVSHAVQRGLSVNIGTNGSCITGNTASVLESLGIQSVTVSLDSHREDVHDAFRRLPGLYSKAVKAIRRLAGQGVRVVVGFTPTRKNWRDGRAVIELACQLGAEAVNLSEYVPAGRGSMDLALTPNELHRVLEEWIAMREEYSGRISIIWHDCRVGMLVPEKDRRDYVGCGAGRLLARILPDGTVTPCVFLPTAIGNYPKSSFSDIWRHAGLMAQFRERTGFKGNCGECEYLYTCGGCRAVAYAYSHGDPLAGDPHCWVRPETIKSMHGMIDGEGLPV